MISVAATRRIDGRAGWVFLSLLLSWSVAQAALMQFPAGSEGVGVANAVYLAGAALSLVGHEMTQGLVGRLFGWRPTSGGPFGSREPRELDNQPRAATAELAMAAAGPVFLLFASFALIAFARVAYVAGAGDPLIRALAAVASLNIVLGIANLLPALPLDGGRALRAVLWRAGKDAGRATRVAGGVSEVIALLIIAIGLATALVGSVADALMWVLCGVLLLIVARSEVDSAAALEPQGADRPSVAEPKAGDRPLRPLS
ncbi:site-2 protease family protein [Phenylobacterium sp. LjRoot219]|uniref:site-2 protease family protein n=1 Tax=Phenylobacterium sp. LjRoot219 TaxID=3342283 RepID=UPI003ECD067A